MVEQFQLSAVIYKTIVLYLRQRKSLVLQTLACIALLLAAGFIRVATGSGNQDMRYGGYSSEYSLNPDVIQNCYYGLPSSWICSQYLWYSFTNPPEGDSAGTLTNSTSSGSLFSSYFSLIKITFHPFVKLINILSRINSNLY